MTQTSTPATHPSPTVAPSTSKPARCATHPGFDADYCPRCGTATVIESSL